MQEKYTDNMANKSKKKLRKKSKYVTGGSMYSTNTIPAGYGPGNTTNIVAEESDPNAVKIKEEAFAAEQERLNTLANTASEKIAQDQEMAAQNIEIAAAQSEGQADAAVGLARQVGDKFVKPQNRTNPFTPAVQAFKATKAVNLAAKAQRGVTAGVQTAKQAAQGAKALQLASQTSKIPVGVAAPQTVSSLAQGAKGASAIGAGLKNFATSGAGIGTIASLAGAGVSRLSDDKDATTMTFGEGTGKVLSGIGTGLGTAALAGMALGSAVPLVGNVVGAAAGAIYGLTKGLIARNKARREKAKADRAEQKFVKETNKDVTSRFGAQASNVRAQRLRSKTFSGYNQGVNTTVKMGGLRLGMPRY